MKLIEKFEKENTKKIKFLGFTLYKRHKTWNTQEKTWCKFLFKKYKESPYKGIYTLKKYYIFNILIKKIKIKEIDLILRENTRIALNGVCRLNTIGILHQKTFTKYKNVNQGKTVVLVGAGPSVNYFEPLFFKNAIFIGCNRAFLIKNIDFDYLFSIDKVGIQNYYDDFFNYRKEQCVKFLGDQNLGIDFQIPESYINKFKNIERYKTTANLLPNRYTFDIDCEPLGNFNSVAMQAIQFILFTNPQKIYLVGIDCNTATAGYFTGNVTDTSFRGESQILNDNNSIKYWTECNYFKNLYYPETTIISVNPVGLKGIFKDIYTKTYLNQHPEIRDEPGYNANILKDVEVINAQ